MTLPASYKVGTATVANGDTTIVGIGTAWALASVLPGDTFEGADGRTVEITEVTDNTHLVIRAWPGAGQTAGYYRIVAIMRLASSGNPEQQLPHCKSRKP